MSTDVPIFSSRTKRLVHRFRCVQQAGLKSRERGSINRNSGFSNGAITWVIKLSSPVGAGGGSNFVMSAGLAYVLLPHLDGLAVWAVLAAVVGFAFGTLFAVSAPLATDCFGMAHFGAIFGLVFTAYGFVAGPLGPWLSGHVLDSTQGNFQVVFTYLGVFFFASAVLIWFARPPKGVAVV